MCCPRCESDNPERMKFCIECAAPLTPRIPHCGFVNPPQARFRGQCAALLSEPLPAAALPLCYTPAELVERNLRSKIALEGQHKQVTVLFPDAKLSVELLVDRDPEEEGPHLDPPLDRMLLRRSPEWCTAWRRLALGPLWRNSTVFAGQAFKVVLADPYIGSRPANQLC